MEIVTGRDSGLFPVPGHISFECSCPDWAGMCKHIAAVLYGVGVRLDEQPELLFTLRGVDHGELISGAADDSAALILRGARGRKVIESANLSALFGIDLEVPPSAAEATEPTPATGRRSAKTMRPAKSKPSKRARSSPLVTGRQR